MSEEPDSAYTESKQDAYGSADAGKPHLGWYKVGSSPEEC